MTKKATLSTLETSGSAIRQIRQADLITDGYMLARFGDITNSSYESLQSSEYDNMRPGRNAANQLARKVAWGAYLDDTFLWSDREAYRLPKELNAEEGGRVRLFDTLSREFLEHPITENLLRCVFNAWSFEKDSSEQLYQVQLSAIRYEPTFENPAFPSPVEAHQDMVDGVIVVLNKTENLIGGTSRLYNLDKEPLVELDLAVGDMLFVKDDAIMHQVSPILLMPGERWHPKERVYRDVLLIRFQAVGR